jgi:hypothetical protein
MVLCPIALAVGCRKCPVFKVCPVKGVIGDYKPPVEPTKSAAAPPKRAAAPAKRAAAAKKRRR